MKKAKFFKVTFLSLMTIFCFSFATVEHRPTLRADVFFEAPLHANQEFVTDLYYTHTNRLYVFWSDNGADWGDVYEFPIPESTRNIAEESLVRFINSIEVSNVIREFMYIAESVNPDIYDHVRIMVSTIDDEL